MKKTKKIITILTCIFLLFAHFGVVNAQTFFNTTLPDPGDRLQVFSPAANSFVKGNINISIIIVEDDATSVEYTVGLYDSANCSSLVGNITAGNDEGNINYSWDTRTTQSTSNLQDGEYCLKVCTVLQNDGANSYSACNGRRINVLNNNTKPIITSNLSKIDYINGDGFSYQLNATDAENDTLKYRLVSAPGFLTINPDTGLITNVSPLNTNGAFGLQYTATVGVTDNKSGEATQTITFNIYAQDPNAPVPTNNNTGGGNNNNPTTDPNTTDEKPVDVNIPNFEFVGIGEDADIEDNIIKLEWTYGNSAESIASSVLQFSNDGVTWNDLATDISPDTTSYEWDISELPSDEYYVRLIINKIDQSKQVEESEPFIVNSQNDGENTNEALIISVLPEPNGQTNEVRPTISGELLPSTGSTISKDSFSLLLDGRDISDSCEISEDNKFECKIKDDLDTGRHVISASFSDDAGKTAEREWTFSVKESVVDSGTVIDDSTENGLSQSAILFILLILGLGLIVLIVPWVLYTLWSRNNTKETKTTTSSSTYNVTNTAPVASTEPQVDAYENFDYQYPDININTEYAQPEATTSTDSYIQPYDLNTGVAENTTTQDTLATQQNTSTDAYIQPYNDANSQDFVEPEQTS